MSEHHHDRRFSPEKLAKLESPERREEQPPERVRDALQLAPGHVVADLGIGTGFFARPIAAELQRLGADGRVIGLDVAPRMLEDAAWRAAAEGLADRIELVEVSGEGDLPLADASVDRVVSVAVVHELDDRPRVWRECRRILRTGGLVLLVDWHADGPFEKGPPAHHRNHPDEIAGELRAAGFEVAARDDFAPMYGLLATTPAREA